MKSIITYKSRYGSSKQYADWIAKALQCDKEDIGNIKVNRLLTYDTIVHVGGLYAGGISGFRFLKKHLEALSGKTILLCMVGMTNPDNKERYNQIYENNVPEPYRNRVKPFALHGNLLFSKMNFTHRLMMKMPKAQAEKTPVEQRTEDNKLFLESYGKDVYLTKQGYIGPIIEYMETVKP